MDRTDWGLWIDIYSKIGRRAITACSCDNCKGNKVYLNEEIMDCFLKGLELSFNLNPITISEDADSMAQFVANMPKGSSSCYSAGRYFNLECKNQGWFECEECSVYFGIKELGNIDALTDITEPFLCKKCLVVVEERLQRDKKMFDDFNELPKR